MKFRVLDKKVRLESILITDSRNNIPTQETSELRVDLNGFPGDRHYGIDRKSGVREINLYPKGTQIPNFRQWSAVSVEDLDKIAQNMGLDEVKPEWIGANLLFSGIENFSSLPPLTRIRNTTTPACTLIVYEENNPCRFPQPFIDEGSNQTSSKGFASAAMGLRGIVGWIEQGGVLKSGDIMELWIPDHREWIEL
jgi:hypothetical protein